MARFGVTDLGVEMRIRLRALLAVGLLVGLIVLAATVLVVTLGSLVWALATRSPLAQVIGWVVIPTVFGVGYGLLPLLRARRGPAPGTVVGRLEQPELWRMVEEIADRVETRPPDEIRLVADANAAVSEESRWLGLVSGERRLYVGVPLMQCLTVRELEWVLAHEMGHYSERHTALGPVAYRGLAAISEMVTVLGPKNLVGRLLAAYGRFYSRVTHGMSRQQELDADRWAAQLFGTEVGISALREVEVVSAAFACFVHDYATVGEPLALRPDRFFEGFDALCRAPGRLTEWEHVRTTVPEHPSSPYDTHPPTRVRIERLESMADPREPDAAVQALTVLTDPEATASRVEADAFGPSGLLPVPWEQAISHGWARRTEERAAWVMTVFDALGSGTSDLSEVLALVAHGRHDDVATILVGADAPAEVRSTAVQEALGVVVAAALLSTGSARYELRWDRADVLVDESGSEIEVGALVGGVVGDPSAAEWLLGVLADEGVSRTWRPGISATFIGPAGPEVYVVAVNRPGRRGHYPVLYVTDAGIGVRKIRFPEWVSVPPIGLRKDVRHVLAHALGVTGTQLLADSSVQMIPWDDVVGVRYVDGASPRVVVRRTSGRPIDVRVYPDGLAGELFEALARFNHGRMALG